MAKQSRLLPVADKMVDDQAKIRTSWLLYFQQEADGDTGTPFVPNIQNLGSNGTPTINGVFYQNQGFADFYVRITPGTNTSATAGSTYFTLPFTVTSDCPCFATSGASSTIGGIVASVNQVYPPAWSNVTTPVTISGRCPIQ